VDSSLEDPAELGKRRELRHRLSAFLKFTYSRDAHPLQYVQGTIQHWLHRHLGRPSNHSIFGEDFNASWQDRPDGVGIPLLSSTGRTPSATDPGTANSPPLGPTLRVPLRTSPEGQR